MTATLSIPNMITRHAYQAAARTPIGQTAILCGAEFAGTVTRIKRITSAYWTIIMSVSTSTFCEGTPTSQTIRAHVWQNSNGRWIVDYRQDLDTLEVSDCRTLEAALGVAVWSVAERGHAKNLW